MHDLTSPKCIGPTYPWKKHLQHLLSSGRRLVLGTAWVEHRLHHCVVLCMYMDCLFWART